MALRREPPHMRFTEPYYEWYRDHPGSASQAEAADAVAALQRYADNRVVMVNNVPRQLEGNEADEADRLTRVQLIVEAGMSPSEDYNLDNDGNRLEEHGQIHQLPGGARKRRRRKSRKSRKSRKTKSKRKTKRRRKSRRRRRR